MDPRDPQHVSIAFNKLRDIVRELTNAGAQPLPPNPDRRNLLARLNGSPCRLCGLVGHQTKHLNNAPACRAAIICLIDFWEDTHKYIKLLYVARRDFKVAIQANRPMYEMSFDDAPLVGGSMCAAIVNHLTRSYLKFQRHMARILAKAKEVLEEAEVKRYEDVSEAVNGL